jgi:NAD(P)H-hydrate epimerase
MEVNHKANIKPFPIFDAREAAAFDEYSIKEKAIDSRLLMGWAGYSVFLSFLDHNWFRKSRHIHIMCGTGNNGGDGYVLAWHLVSAGYPEITIWQTGVPHTDDAAWFCSLVQSVENSGQVRFKPIHNLTGKVFSENDILVDAIFGTGLNKPPGKDIQDIFELVNSRNDIIRIAIDVPSGIYASGDNFQHSAFRALMTFTFGSYKIGHLVEPGINFSGVVIVRPIGFFPLQEKLNRRLADYKNFPRLRKYDGHKYKSGVVSIMGGSSGMEGASIMAARSFLSLGGGLANIFSSSPFIKTALQENPELMIQQLSDTDAMETAVADSISAAGKNHVLIIGPGLKEIPGASFWKTLSVKSGLNLIVDGSGLSQLSEHEKILKNNCVKNLVLTPHNGEAEKLLGRKIQNIRLDAIEIASRYNAHVYLKGPGGILVLNRQGKMEEIYLNSRHYELSTGGTGDVLCGVLANFLCRFENEPSGSGLEEGLLTYLEAADAVVKKNGNNRDFLTPSEMIDQLRFILY